LKTLRRILLSQAKFDVDDVIAGQAARGKFKARSRQSALQSQIRRGKPLTPNC
jgi:hypothetical protein